MGFHEREHLQRSDMNITLCLKGITYRWGKMDQVFWSMGPRRVLRSVILH